MVGVEVEVEAAIVLSYSQLSTREGRLQPTTVIGWAGQCSEAAASSVVSRPRWPRPCNLARTEDDNTRSRLLLLLPGPPGSPDRPPGQPPVSQSH